MNWLWKMYGAPLYNLVILNRLSSYEDLGAVVCVCVCCDGVCVSECVFDGPVL